MKNFVLVLMFCIVAMFSYKAFAETKIYLENKTITYVYNADEQTAIDCVEELKHFSLPDLEENDGFRFVIDSFIFGNDGHKLESQVNDLLKANPEGTVVSISFSDGYYVATRVKAHYVAAFSPSEQ